MKLKSPTDCLCFAFPLPAPRSRRSRLIARWFGLSNQCTEREDAIQPAIDLHPLLPSAGKIVLISGASGSGKSSLMRMMREELARQGAVRVIDLAEIVLPDRPLIDCFERMRLFDVLGLLSRVGLAEAWSYLRTPGELSEGQRWRLRLGLGLAALHRRGETNEPQQTVLFCDEFAAVLDRVTAAVIAYALRRAVTVESQIGAVVATSHDDLIDALKPDLQVRCDFGRITVERADR